MLPITLISTKSEKMIYALLDEGSTVTLINSRIIEEIGGKKTQCNLVLRGVGTHKTITVTSEKVNILIKGKVETFPLAGILVVNDLALLMQHVTKQVANLCRSVTGVTVSHYSAAPDLLIGQDHGKSLFGLLAKIKSVVMLCREAVWGGYASCVRCRCGLRA